uniref:PiggyBac transposable element-derived protein domain-containing protein n=1 Tax=Glossina austeni TaxID=7395 RepID=A0A1A9V7W1_GLOAU
MNGYRFVFTVSFVYSSPKMSRHSRNINLLDKIDNIDGDCSEDDQEVYDIDDEPAKNYCDSFDSDTDEENILNIRRGQKKKRLIVSSESENKEEIEIAMDGTVWKKIKEGSNSGKASVYNIFKEVSGPTGYAKRNIMKGRVKSAFSLIIDHKMIEHLNRIKKYYILSSMHSPVEIEKNDTRIPETIRFYNSTKFGVDVTDQMARKYSVFFNILDLAGVNAWILYKETTGEEILRQQFLFQLAEELGTLKLI